MTYFSKKIKTGKEIWEKRNRKANRKKHFSWKEKSWKNNLKSGVSMRDVQQSYKGNGESYEKQHETILRLSCTDNALYVHAPENLDGLILEVYGMWRVNGVKKTKEGKINCLMSRNEIILRKISECLTLFNNINPFFFCILSPGAEIQKCFKKRFFFFFAHLW